MTDKERLYWAEVGLRIQIARSAKHLTQAQLAKKTGLSRSAIAMMEAGKQGIYLEQITRICTALQVPPRFFIPKIAKT